ncbi:SsrA-binding protein [Peptoniphilus asaccharolyticus DSM 20463]|uniref:SsrA-binding protein n=1 Tax=Peptoniphilus asaccharolyticus DSM 20463 TaxID=573058 RepID=A0A1W1VAN6_PEPAS|nr:SsrA-binding protein SmpB [Peptoniphilus asaccharolyticus]MBL7575774.1 SsrA-binding protein SmpB [Peptoniphilus asaccharolyticus]SMB90034.1 SsrA-binding protein [Peptoniphilus asaccharolyticus DSM 20463]
MSDNTIASNRKARHDYFIQDTLEVGIVLVGTEVKSLRQGKANLKDSYASISGGEVFVEGMHISPYEQGNIFNVDPMRKRKLLLNRTEIRKLEKELTIKGNTLVPLKLYLKNGRVKMELAVAKGKKLYDKRDTMAKKDADRKIQQALKERY